MNAPSVVERTPCSAAPLVFEASPSPPEHAELLSICERLAHVWSGRTRSECELWNDLNRELAGTSSVAEALQAFSENAAKRIRVALENAQRIFEENQTMAARFSPGRAPSDPRVGLVVPG